MTSCTPDPVVSYRFHPTNESNIHPLTTNKKMCQASNFGGGAGGQLAHGNTTRKGNNFVPHSEKNVKPKGVNFFRPPAIPPHQPWGRGGICERACIAIYDIAYGIVCARAFHAASRTTRSTSATATLCRARADMVDGNSEWSAKTQRGCLKFVAFYRC